MLSEECQRQIEQIVEEYGSWEHLRQVLTENVGAPHPLIGFHDELCATIESQKITDQYTAFVSLVEQLGDFKHWRSLAADPKLFKAKLDHKLKCLNRLISLISGVKVPRHRPKTNAERDRRIFELKKRGLTFGQIAQKEKITARAAGLAYTRHDSLQKNRLKQILELTFGEHDEAVKRYAQKSE